MKSRKKLVKQILKANKLTQKFGHEYMYEAHHILSDFVNKNLGRVSRRNGITQFL